MKGPCGATAAPEGTRRGSSGSREACSRHERGCGGGSCATSSRTSSDASRRGHGVARDGAAGEEVDRPAHDRLDDADEVVGVISGVVGMAGSSFTLRRCRVGRSHDRGAGRSGRQGAEARRDLVSSERRPAASRLGRTDVVGERRAGDVRVGWWGGVALSCRFLSGSDQARPRAFGEEHRFWPWPASGPPPCPSRAMLHLRPRRGGAIDRQPRARCHVRRWSPRPRWAEVLARRASAFAKPSRKTIRLGGSTHQPIVAARWAPSGPSFLLDAPASTKVCSR